MVNRRIFDKCVYVINLLITDSMDDFEKQMAIHDWIIDWAAFDDEFFSDAPDANPDPNNDNPYGLFFSQVANCYGFTDTFQLFMDLLGVECITVHGTDFSGGRHAWNLVRIDGVWYAVDITWNNPVDFPRNNRPRSVTHRFFNVTSETLFFYGHRWDRDSVPEATGSRPSPPDYQGVTSH
jgi:transglutaminase/protease-like cytokinesis protein 3